MSGMHRFVYLGYDKCGMTHVPVDTMTTIDVAACRPSWGVKSLVVIVKFARSAELTCLECIVRYEHVLRYVL